MNVRRWLTQTLAVAAAVTVGIAGYVGATAVDVVVAGRDTSATADVIVVLGAAQYDGTPSPLLASRLETALALYRKGSAPLIAVTGGKSEGDRFTEAAASRRWLVDHGVASGAIVAEDIGRSTWESLSSLQPVLRQNGVKSVIAVSSSWHVARAGSMLRELGFHVATVESPNGVLSSRVERNNLLQEIAGVAIGRLVGFENLEQL